MIAIGAGGLDVAVAMGGGRFYLTAPEGLQRRADGRAPALGHGQGRDPQDARAALDQGQRRRDAGVRRARASQTLTRAGARHDHQHGRRDGRDDLGLPLGRGSRAGSSRPQGREKDWQALAADADAAYDRVDRTRPLRRSSRWPRARTAPDNVKNGRELAGMKVDQVCIGSCTNSSYKDLMTVAAILKGRKVAPEREPRHRARLAAGAGDAGEGRGVWPT